MTHSFGHLAIGQDVTGLQMRKHLADAFLERHGTPERISHPTAVS
jgi:hypothetical protein